MQQLNRQPKALQLFHQHMERLRDARLRYILALDYRLIGLDPADDVVGFEREHLLQVVGGAVRLKRPHLHFAEPLSAELRLAAQRLLRYQRVGAGGSRVYLVLDQVYEFHHIDVAHRDWLVKRLAGAPVVQHGFAQRGRGYLLFAVQPQRLFAHALQRIIGNIARLLFPQPDF